jgi:phosphoglycerate dehydrogenase-like enzyme
MQRCCVSLLIQPHLYIFLRKKFSKIVHFSILTECLQLSYIYIDKRDLIMIPKIPLVIQGAESVEDVPGLSAIANQAELRFAPDISSLESSLPGAEVLFGWDFRADELQKCWNLAPDLKWIHWGGAGVDAAMFAELKISEVILTNSRGIFDRGMAEWTLGMMIAHSKNVVELLDFQRKNEWNYRLNQLMIYKNVLVVGVGSIGREVARICKAFSLNVTGVGRTARDNDPDFGHVHAQGELNSLLGSADYVVLITPLTPETENLFSKPQFDSMKPDAQFINIGRGDLVNEVDLIAALENKSIGSAALDVFREEPLSPDNPIRTAPNTIISPHVCGDYKDFRADVANVFFKNFELYRTGRELVNIVDKSAGFVPSITS